MINRDTLLIGDQKTFTYKTSVPKGAKFVIHTPDSASNGVEIVGKPKFDTLSSNGGVNQIQTTIVVTSFDSGSHFVPKMPALVLRSDGSTDTIWFGGERVEYTTIQIDTTSYKPYDVKGQVEYPITLAEVLMWSGGALLFAALIILIIRYLKRRRANRGFFEAQVADEPPYLRALRELENIKSQKLWQSGKEKQYYTHITDVLRGYIESRFNIPAMEYTSAEILRELSGRVTDEQALKVLRELLNVADLVKFAKYKATVEENEGAVPAAIKFVNGTYEADKESNIEKEV